MSPRVLVGAVGHPWLRDLDVGSELVRRLEALSWPEGVSVEDLSVSAIRVHHRLTEESFDKVVLVGAVRRGRPPGEVVRYRPSHRPDPGDVQARIGESVGGVIDLDHILAVGLYYGSFPDDTVVIEVEPAEEGFGTGFSPQVEAAVPEIVAMVRQEVARAFRRAATRPEGENRKRRHAPRA